MSFSRDQCFGRRKSGFNSKRTNGIIYSNIDNSHHREVTKNSYRKPKIIDDIGKEIKPEVNVSTKKDHNLKTLNSEHLLSAIYGGNSNRSKTIHTSQHVLQHGGGDSVSKSKTFTTSHEVGHTKLHPLAKETKHELNLHSDNDTKHDINDEFSLFGSTFVRNVNSKQHKLLNDNSKSGHVLNVNSSTLDITHSGTGSHHALSKTQPRVLLDDTKSLNNHTIQQQHIGDKYGTSNQSFGMLHYTKNDIGDHAISQKSQHKYHQETDHLPTKSQNKELSGNYNHEIVKPDSYNPSNNSRIEDSKKPYGKDQSSDQHKGIIKPNNVNSNNSAPIYSEIKRSKNSNLNSGNPLPTKSQIKDTSRNPQDLSNNSPVNEEMIHQVHAGSNLNTVPQLDNINISSSNPTSLTNKDLKQPKLDDPIKPINLTVNNQGTNRRSVSFDTSSDSTDNEIREAFESQLTSTHSTLPTKSDTIQSTTSNSNHSNGGIVQKNLREEKLIELITKLKNKVHTYKHKLNDMDSFVKAQPQVTEEYEEIIEETIETIPKSSTQPVSQVMSVTNTDMMDAIQYQPRRFIQYFDTYLDINLMEIEISEEYIEELKRSWIQEIQQNEQFNNQPQYHQQQLNIEEFSNNEIQPIVKAHTNSKCTSVNLEKDPEIIREWFNEQEQKYSFAERTFVEKLFHCYEHNREQFVTLIISLLSKSVKSVSTQVRLSSSQDSATNTNIVKLSSVGVGDDFKRNIKIINLDETRSQLMQACPEMYNKYMMAKPNTTDQSTTPDRRTKYHSIETQSSAQKTNTRFTQTITENVIEYAKNPKPKPVEQADTKVDKKEKEQETSEEMTVENWTTYNKFEYPIEQRSRSVDVSSVGYNRNYEDRVEKILSNYDSNRYSNELARNRYEQYQLQNKMMLKPSSDTYQSRHQYRNDIRDIYHHQHNQQYNHKPRLASAASALSFNNNYRCSRAHQPYHSYQPINLKYQTSEVDELTRFNNCMKNAILNHNSDTVTYHHSTKLPATTHSNDTTRITHIDTPLYTNDTSNSDAEFYTNNLNGITSFSKTSSSTICNNENDTKTQWTDQKLQLPVNRTITAEGYTSYNFS